MGLFKSKAPRHRSRLHQAIAESTAREHLYDLPDYLYKLIEEFEQRDVHPDYRRDVYKTLAAAVNICRTVINPTVPAKPAIDEIGQLMLMLPRMLGHLTNRPSTTGYAILMDKEVMPTIFATSEEASHHLARFQQFGAARKATIVQVHITPNVVAQPEAPKKTVPPLVSDGPIPNGIKPPQRQLSFDDLMQRLGRVEGEVTGGLSPPSKNAPEGPPAADRAGHTSPHAGDESPRTAAGGPAMGHP